MKKQKVKLVLFSAIIILIAIAMYSTGPTVSNHVTGNQIIDTKVNILPSPKSNCSFQLQAGWNLVSFYCIGLFANRDDILTSINTSYYSIFSYNPTDAADPWKSYNPSLPNWTVQQLSVMDRTEGYWINMKDTRDYFYEGGLRNTLIPLVDGWNLAGYPSLTTRNINDTLNGLNYSFVITSAGGSDFINVYGALNNTLTDFETYKGYWINSSNVQSWPVNVS